MRTLASVILVCQLAPGTTTGFNEMLWQQQAATATQDMLARGYSQLARDWRDFYPGFHIAHPGLSVNQVLSAFTATELAHGLRRALPPVANTLAEVPGAAAKAAESAILHNPLSGIADFFHRLTEASTWVRVGEVLGGFLLVYIGLKASMTPGGASVATQNVRKTAIRVARKVPGPVRIAARHAPKAGKNR